MFSIDLPVCTIVNVHAGLKQKQINWYFALFQEQYSGQMRRAYWWTFLRQGERKENLPGQMATTSNWFSQNLCLLVTLMCGPQLGEFGPWRKNVSMISLSHTIYSEYFILKSLIYTPQFDLPHSLKIKYKMAALLFVIVVAAISKMSAII
jgi:hypothetical protein